MISVNTAMALDIFGQVASDSIGFKQQSAVGGQVDYVRGAQRSIGGKSIIALPSTLNTSKGRLSRIMFTFPVGTSVSTSRADVQYVVTEFGCVNLKVLTMKERIKAIISLAHPDFREELADQAKVNLRTIQRIENAESEPRGKTLSLICDVLEIDVSQLISTEISLNEKNIGTKIVNAVFLLILNSILVMSIAYLTMDSNTTINSVFGGFLVSIFLPFFIVFMTKKMSSLERMLKFGFGYIIYFILVTILFGFPKGFTTGLFPCLLISLSVLYFGNELIKNKD